MNLLIDYINEQLVRAFTGSLEKINYNINQIPALKESIAKQRNVKQDAFTTITVMGRWIIVYCGDNTDDENTIMHFIDFRIEIDEKTMKEIFSSNVISAMKELQTQYDSVFTRQHDTIELQFAPPFSQSLINEWENDHCVNFAIALSRKTGWILHTDAWVNSSDPEENIPSKDRITLRVYVGDNLDNIFDVQGIVKLQDFYQNTIKPLTIKKATSRSGSVSTRLYTEEQLFELPLDIKPEESKISKAIDAIEANKMFLESIPARQQPLIPSHIASKFTYGLCGPFAEALHDFTKLPITAMIALKYMPQFEHSRFGYVHSFILHPDGHGEDSWGKQTIEEIAGRFGVMEFQLSEIEHTQAVLRLKANSADKYEQAYNEAKNVIKKYWSF